jgi:xanthine dehydrogenase YagR molybdenum-binding subunit
MTATLGEDAQRIDGRDKVSGKPIYGADRILRKMVHAVPVAATVRKGRITGIDKSGAQHTPGVLLILTHENFDRLRPVQFSFAGGTAIQSFQPLQSAEVKYRGQAVALVVAETLEAAQEAAALIRVSYSEDASATVELNAPGGTSVKQAVATPFFKDFVAGDPEAAIAAAPVRFEQTYLTAPQHQNPIELLSTVAEWQGDQLIVHEGTQAASAMRAGLATQLGIPLEKVRVLSPYVGGAFGQRGSISPHTVFAAVAARRVGRPVKLVVPRAQVFHATSFRAPTEHKITFGADTDGRFVGGIHLVRALTSRFDLMPFTGQESTSRMYNWKTFRGATTLIQGDVQTPGFMRAPFEATSYFALESAMDEFAIQLGLDPIELRLRNDTHKDPISGKPYTVRKLRECLERGAERFGWSRRNPQPGSMRDPDGTLIGWGMAAGAYPYISAAAVATARLSSNGQLTIDVGGHEMGQGIRTAIAIVAAEELGIEADAVTVRVGDTAIAPQHVTAGASGAVTSLPPVRLAVRDLRTQIDRLATMQGNSRVEPSGYVGLMQRAGLKELVGSGQELGPQAKPDVSQQIQQGWIAFTGPEFPDFVAFSYIAHFAEVRIDPRLPTPHVARYVSVIDCGRVISRRTAMSQAYGGIIWGIESALSEASEVDPRYGGFLNSNLAEYAMAVNADIRDLDVSFIDEPDERVNALGAKGVGEVVSVGAIAAIANAIHHATGKRVRHFPIRADDLLA